MSKLVKFLSVLALVSAMALVGCEKSDGHEGHDHAVGEGHDDVAEVKAAVEEVILQKTCPVMDGEIDEKLFVLYKGKKVYFCCAGCEKTFNADPEKYVEKLPQFNK